MLLLLLVAQAAPGVDPVSLAPLGVAGPLVVIVLWLYRQERARADSAQQAHLDDLRSLVPAIEQSTAATTATRQAIEAFVADYQRDQRDLRGRS